MCAREALIDAFPVVEPESEWATKKNINETKQARSCRRKRKQDQQ